MVVVMRPGAAPEEVDAVVARVEAAGAAAFISRGVQRTIVGLVGDITHFASLNLRAMAWCRRGRPGLQAYKLVSREHHPVPTTGPRRRRADRPDTFTLIAGPCAVETAEQTFEAADMAKAAGATMLRGGAYKPRTSPYAFQGLGVKGLEILAEARERTGLPVVTEVVDPKDVAVVAEYADMLQIGTRNMQNFPLLQAVGGCASR
jgi:3-deoxy-7-phosphoheptulonate synthase